MLGRLADDTPVVLVIEDLHWADRSTRDLLGFLIRSLHGERVVLVATYRSDELHRRHPLRPFLAQHSRAPGIDRVDLRRFERAELADQLQGILGKPAPEAVVEKLLERSEGNAFFAEELLAAANEGGRGELPDTLRDALMVRIETLAVPTQHVLRTAAAIGRRAGHRLLAATAGLDEAELDGALREAVEHHVLEQREDAYQFRHALLREAVYTDLLPGERVRMHELIARRLAERPELSGDDEGGVGGGAVELAYHWRAAGDVGPALAASVQAGRTAEEVTAAPEAQRQFEHALRLWERVPDAAQVAGMDQAELLHRAAEAAHLAGDNGRAAALGREAVAVVDRAADPARAGLLLGLLGMYVWETGRADEALALLEEAAATVPPQPPTRERARVLAELGFMLVLQGRASESRSVSEEAVAVARSVGARAEECHALIELGHAHTFEGQWDRGEEAIRAALLIALELRQPATVGNAYGGIGDTIDRAGRVADAAELALQAVEVARDLGTERSFGVFQLSEASDRLLRLGRFAEAERAARTALELRPSGIWGRLAHEATARVALSAGDFDTAQAHLDKARAGHDPGSGPMWTGPLETIAAELALARRAPEEAAAIATAEISRRAGARLRVLRLRAALARRPGPRGRGRAGTGAGGGGGARDRARAGRDAARRAARAGRATLRRGPGAAAGTGASGARRGRADPASRRAAAGRVGARGGAGEHDRDGTAAGLRRLARGGGGDRGRRSGGGRGGAAARGGAAGGQAAAGGDRQPRPACPARRRSTDDRVRRRRRRRRCPARPHRPRARGAAARRRRADEQGDRCRALHEPEDRFCPRLPHPRQARRPLPRRSRRRGPPARPVRVRSRVARSPGTIA